MKVFKSREERQQDKAARQQRAAEAKQRRAEERFLASPVGLATTALAHGESILQVTVEIDASTSGVLMEIESLGWHLQHMDVVSELTIHSTGNGDGGVSDVHSSSSLVGVYVFRQHSIAQPTPA